MDLDGELTLSERFKLIFAYFFIFSVRFLQANNEYLGVYMLFCIFKKIWLI